MGTAAAIVGGSLIQGYIGDRASRRAARQRAAAEALSRKEREKYYGFAQDNLNPYMEAGSNALSQYAEYGPSKVSFDPSNLDLYRDPSYQFRLGEQNRAIDRGMAAGGKFFSGNRLEELMKRSGQMASQEYGNAYNRMERDFVRDYGQESDFLNRLALLAGRGQNAASNLSSIGMSAATGNAASLSSEGQAKAAGTIGSTNSWMNALGDMAYAAGRYNNPQLSIWDEYGVSPAEYQQYY